MKNKESKRIGIILLCLAAFFLMLPSYNTSLEKKGGQLLVAAPKLQQEPFNESVLFLYQYSLFSALAMMINRPLDGVPEGVAESIKNTKLPLYYGGPVEFPHRIYVLQISGDTLLLEEITDLSTVPEMLEAKLADVEKSMQSKDARIILGYAGWGILQLTMEALRGYWDFVEVDPGVLKNTSGEDLWRTISGQSVDNPVEKPVEK